MSISIKKLKKGDIMFSKRIWVYLFIVSVAAPKEASGRKVVPERELFIGNDEACLSCSIASIASNIVPPSSATSIASNIVPLSTASTAPLSLSGSAIDPLIQ